MDQETDPADWASSIGTSRGIEDTDRRQRPTDSLLSHRPGVNASLSAETEKGDDW